MIVMQSVLNRPLRPVPVEEVSAAIGEERAKRGALEDSVKTTKGKVDDLTSAVGELRSLGESLKGEISSLREVIEAPEVEEPEDTRLADCMVECATLKAELKAANDRIAVLEAECAECEAECEQCESDLVAEQIKNAELSARLESERSERDRSMATFREIIAGMKKEEKKEEKAEEAPRSLEIDVVRGGDNLTRRLKVKMV